jgi:sec-independent protein translocase protein TatB
MFDISWTEFLLIGVVALVVIGPKELPAVMRTMGQWTRKVRGMASDFQNQFQEAMREAEMADLKKQVDDMARDVKDIDPLKGVRDDIESAGKDVERSLASTPEQPAALAAAGSEPALTEPPAEPAPAPAETASVSVAEEPAAPPETIDKAEQADGTGRAG